MDLCVLFESHRITFKTIRLFLENYPDGVVIFNHQSQIQFFNKSAEKTFLYRRGQAKNLTLSALIAPSARGNYEQKLKLLHGSSSQIISGEKFEAVGLKKDKTELPIELSLHKITTEEGEFFLSFIEDISNRIEMQNKLYQQAITDSLTGLYNRRYFDEKITKEFQRSKRHKRIFSILIVDIDGFKQANDLYGHSFGDELLIKARDVFQQVLRTEDAIFRYGGDEFAMILPETVKEGAIDVSERLKLKFAKEFNFRDKRMQFSLSIGIASHPEDGSTEKQLLHAADSRMYLSKERGGNIITSHDKTDEITINDELLLRSLAKLISLMDKHNQDVELTNISHATELRALSSEIGRRLGLSPARLYVLEQASMLHDIGTLHISNSIFNKEEKLTESEWVEIKKHVEIGEMIIGLIATNEKEELHDLKNIVAQHHEWVNGEGYPRGLKGDEILLEAKILAATDAYSAMTNRRPYRDAMSKTEALAELNRNVGQQFDSRVVEVLTDLEKNNELDFDY